MVEQQIVLKRLPARSLGAKLIVICGLALLMTIPALFVGGLVRDRTRRALAVTKEISAQVGGPQTFLGPTLAIPYSIPARPQTVAPVQGVYLVFPSKATAALRTRTTERHRSLFRVPVFQAYADLEANFNLAGVPSAPPPGAAFDWSRAEIVVGVSDARGAMADATLTMDGKTVTLAPSELSDRIFLPKEDGSTAGLTLFGANAGGMQRVGTSFSAVAKLQFSGAQRVAVLSYGKTTHLTERGDWRSPGFDGGFLPVTQTVTKQGFSAEWAVPFIARGVRTEGSSESILGLNATALGVSFIEVADSYQSVDRSLKYVLLFVGLVFLSYFVFEMASGKRVHPAQYVLVGVAQSIFYLLLLSFAERIGFDWGFALAAGATVTLLAVNAGWIFESRQQGQKAFATFSGLYLLIYLLLRLEDNALLVGALASFGAVAAVMYLTRRMDWYGALPMAAVTSEQ